MFTNIIVAVDGSSADDRVLPVVRALTFLGDVGVELLTVVPANTDHRAAAEPDRRVAPHGWPVCARRTIVAADVAAAIAAEANARPEALLVMATSAKSPLVGHLLGSVSEAVLRLVERPVLLVGPHVPAEFTWTRPTPLVCVQPGTAAPETIAAVIAFRDSFAAAPPRIVEIVPEVERRTAATPTAEDRGADLRDLAAELAVDGVDARIRVLRGGVPEIRLEGVADLVPQPVFVVASARWTGGRHVRSTTRQLVHRSSHPVLVVPFRSESTVHADVLRATARGVDVLVP